MFRRICHAGHRQQLRSGYGYMLVRRACSPCRTYCIVQPFLAPGCRGTRNPPSPCRVLSAMSAGIVGSCPRARPSFLSIAFLVLGTVARLLSLISGSTSRCALTVRQSRKSTIVFYCVCRTAVKHAIVYRPPAYGMEVPIQ